MLKLKVFDRGNEVVLSFEHSLLSLSKWEAKTKKAFLTSRKKSDEEMLEYFQCMLMSPEDQTDLVLRISPSQMEQIIDYIQDPMTASVAPEDPDAKKSNEVMTTETIYSQMALLRIPFETETWHINRLMMLIAKTAHAQKPPDNKKKPTGNLLNRWQEINQRNRERFNSKG